MRLVTTSDFDITLKAPTGVSFPYNQNNVLDKFLGGKIWMANDGGVYWSEDGGRSWKLSVGLNTVDRGEHRRIVRPGQRAGAVYGVRGQRRLLHPRRRQDLEGSHLLLRRLRCMVFRCRAAAAGPGVSAARRPHVCHQQPPVARLSRRNEPGEHPRRPAAPFEQHQFGIRHPRLPPRHSDASQRGAPGRWRLRVHRHESRWHARRSANPFDQFDHRPGSLGRPQQGPTNRTSRARPGGSRPGRRRTSGSGVFRRATRPATSGSWTPPRRCGMPSYRAVPLAANPCSRRSFL